LRVWDDEPKRRRAHLDAVIIERITLDNRYYGFRGIAKSSGAVGYSSTTSARAD